MTLKPNLTINSVYSFNRLIVTESEGSLLIKGLEIELNI